MKLAEIVGSRTYETQHGTKAAIKLRFESGEVAELTTNADTLGKRMETLLPLVGKDESWTLQDGGKRADDTPKPMKVTDWPGKPQQQGGGGGGGSSWYNSVEGVRFTQERMDRRTALMQAVLVLQTEWPKDVKRDDGTPISDTMSVASDFYRWLRETAGAQQASPTPAAAGTTGEGGSGSMEPTHTAVTVSPSPVGDCPHPSSAKITKKLDGEDYRGGWGRCGACGKEPLGPADFDKEVA